MARADRPALSTVTTDGPPDVEAARRAVEALWRIESARIIGALARYTGDFALAEDVAQEAVAQALVGWARDGVPANPVGWLLTTARRRAVDAFRRRAALDDRYAVLAGQLAEPAGGSGDGDLPWGPDRVDDDVLALMFVACHPVLAPPARLALTLRVVGGLSCEEIARALLVPVPTVQARITRAKKTIAAARVPFALPEPPQRRERLGAVLGTLYVIFTEGSTATAGADLLRPDLAYEAIRLARTLAALLPAEPEVYGLLALCELTAARFPARVDADGEAVLLADQDRRRWDRSAVRRGMAALGRVAPSPVVELNRAVAVAMADGPQPALALVDEVAATGRLAGSHLLPGVRGELLARLGRTAEARAELEFAARLCRNVRERTVLLRRADDLDG
ncbi:RNA polymerase sigma factor [Micromonospora wenchangensis]|uniref:RNA polymerase sigma factor n=1 Tax=Micromonospora wenchangensis TaxID=1185415 RepID=UPI0037F5D89F